MIKINNLTKKYKSAINRNGKFVNYALDNVSCTISEGKIYAVLGVNGAGKTTLLKAISGMIKPSQGKILIDDEKITEKTYNKLIYIPDYETHFAGFTIRDMMDFYKDFYDSWNEEKAKDMLKFFELEENMKIDSLSRGNIAKVKLILAFSLDMKYILLDEPFAGIDIFKRQEFIRLITSFVGHEQSVILTTHEINEIEPVVDHVLVINDGKLVADFDAEVVREIEGKSILEKVGEVSYVK